jgi:acid phosphatase family membrane protein YuiD
MTCAALDTPHPRPHHHSRLALRRAGEGRTDAAKEDATEPFWVALSIGFIVQGYKGFTAFFSTRHWNLRRFVETGGMPSSHSASVAALTTAVGLWHGFDTVLFAVTLYFSVVVMYDAAGLRRAAGRHAMVLNRLIDRHFQQPEKETQKLMELLGHTPFEVLVGAALGVAYALLWFRIHH